MINMNFLNDMKVKHKLYLVYIFCVVAPIIIINLIFYLNMASNVKEIHINYYTSSAQRIAALIEKDLNFLISQANKIYLDQKLYEMLDVEYGRDLDYVETYFDYFMSYFYLHGESYHQINNMRVYTDNPGVLNSGVVRRIDKQLINENWFQRVIDSPNKIHIVYEESENRRDNTVVTPISIIQVLDQYQGIDRYSKILKIEINSRNIMEIISTENIRGNVFLLYDGNRLLFTDNNVMNNKDVTSFLNASKDRLIKNRINDNLKWDIVIVMNNDDLQIALQEPRNSIILLTLASLFLSSFVLILIYRSFYLRLNSLSQHVRSMDQDDFDKQFIGSQGKDEIGNLINAFNRMVRKIKVLITDVYEAKLEQSEIELEKKQAEVNALQSQMNPHFLFNTLESIRMRSLEKKEVETAEVIKYLARSFRRIISYKQEWISVAEELQYIEEFLKIQKYRFDSEFEYFLDIDSQVLNLRIPKLIIQPFIENACIHGIGGIEGNGELYLKLELIDDKLKCIIKDNGIGIEEDKLEQIYDIIKLKEERYNIGIQNVYKRLELYYGKNFEFKIDSKKGQGTVIILKIPRGLI
ncbi:sensor histidine kinase [Natronospora cellulosivora (SeqCode)]